MWRFWKLLNTVSLFILSFSKFTHFFLWLFSVRFHGLHSSIICLTRWIYWFPFAWKGKKHGRMGKKNKMRVEKIREISWKNVEKVIKVGSEKARDKIEKRIFSEKKICLVHCTQTSFFPFFCAANVCLWQTAMFALFE